MITRFNYVRPVVRDSSKDDIFYKWTLEKRIRVLNTQKDGSVDKYIEEEFWNKEQCSWSDFINSYNLGTIQEQVINHLTKGTPLVTAHTLPAGDYTQLEKGAKIKREMDAKGITLDMLLSAMEQVPSKEVKEEVVNG